MERAVFPSADFALRFIFDPERERRSRSPMALLMEPPAGEPGPLSGLDGVAETGMAKAMLEGNLTPFQLALLACRYAPPTVKCECRMECCSGKKPNQQWRDAVRYVAGEALMHPLRGCDKANLTYTAAVVAAEYGGKTEPLVRLGRRFGLSAGACTEHKQKVTEWLLGETEASPRRHGPPRPGREVRAYIAARDALRLGGFVR